MARSITGAAIAAFAMAIATGCGEGTRHASIAPPPQPSSTAASPSSVKKRRGTAPASRPDRATIRLPRELVSYPKAVSRHGWPRPLEVASSFRIAHASANVSCPTAVLASMPPDGVYVAVAEYTDPPPKGIPRPTGLGPRPDLGHLDIRPSEVECWEQGDSGAADFRDHGRAYRVEVLLGPHVGAARRQKVLDALATLRLSG